MSEIKIHFTLIFILIILSLSYEFEQKTDKFFKFDEESDSWVPVELPYEFRTCVNDDCSVVGAIREAGESGKKRVDGDEKLQKRDGEIMESDDHKMVMPVRKRVYLTKMSETSIWVVGESGSIYERFWNGVQWVIAPHDLPSFVGPATCVFIVNQTILALSESGYLYQMLLTENSQLVWTEFAAAVDHIADEERERELVKTGIVANDEQRLYFCTKNGSLLELAQVEPPRWIYHGQPPGADVAAIAGTLRSNIVFTISSAGHLYEHDENTKPPWKKHVWKDGLGEDTSLIPTRGCSTQGSGGASSMSLFLLTKVGKLVERRLNQRKWKWIVHGSSENQILTSITPVLQDESTGKYSIFLTTASGSIVEFLTAKQSSFVNHQHPIHAKVARGVSGVTYQFGRTFFPLDDGRLAELHLSGMGGEITGPFHQINNRRKMPLKYVWTILDVPETEGWNAEYCTDERGPANCIMGVKDESNDFASTRTMTRRRKGSQQTYLIPEISDIDAGKLSDDEIMNEKWVNKFFHMRVIHGGRSFFMVTKNSMVFEYLYNENIELWLRHEHSTSISGAVASYNGSLFLVDIHGSLLIREKSDNELKWINCSDTKKGRQIVGGPPWDRSHGRAMKIKNEDALYFVSKKGRLLQFIVAHRDFRWKDCKNPSNTKVATIADQELLRDKVVFVIGQNGRLYQYNTLSGIWHEHYESPHLVLAKTPGTAMRPSEFSLKGSLFMISEDGGLVEYHWSSLDGWIWVEHGTPNGVGFAGAPGPSFEGHQLFLISSDGKVYLRYLDQTEWKWRDFGFPDSESASFEDDRRTEFEDLKSNIYCDPKVSSTRPILSADDTVMFELRDGRLAEMRRLKDSDWVWSKIIATPTSSCMPSFWAVAAS